MAKCVTILQGDNSGITIRVPDSMATRLVREKRAEYAPREVWKRGERKTVGYKVPGAPAKAV